MQAQKNFLGFPNESEDYRKKRNELLQLEIELRNDIEKVAKARRELPLGGKLKEDYIFEELDSNGQEKQVKFSELFQNNKNSLIIYSLMFTQDDEDPCVYCNSLVDGFNGISNHVNDRVNFVVIAKCKIEKLQTWAKSRNWTNLRLLSSKNNSYNIDYFAEQNSGQMPILNVFERKGEEIFHFTSSELLWVKGNPGQDERHVDMVWPIWNMLDFTREGRGTDWYPKNKY